MSDNIIDLNQLPKGLNVRALLLAIAALGLLWALFSSFYMVDQKEEAVVLRFGQINRTAGPGLHFKLPFGLEQNINVPTQRIFKEEFGFRSERPGVRTEFSRGNFSDESIMLTGDLNILDVKWIIQYRITDPHRFLFQVENPRQTIRDISQSVINQLVGDRTIFDVIGNERAAIETLGQEAMNQYFKQYQMGVRVTTVKLQNVVPPAGRVQDAFEDVNKAIQDRNRLINEGKEAYNNAIPRARGQAQQVLQQAEGYAVERVNRAKGDIARFQAVLEEYRKNPAITRSRIYYEIMEHLLNNSETELIDRGLKNFVPFKALGNNPKPENHSQGGEK